MKNFVEFLRRRRVLTGVTLLVSVFTYITYWINAEDILTDMETYITYPQDALQVYEKAGRFGLIFTKSLFFTKVYVPALVIGYMIAALTLASLVLDYGVWRIGGGKNKLELFYLIFNCLFVSSPVLTHQFYFYYQAFEVSFAFLLGVLAAYWVTRGCLKKKWILILMGIAAMIWSFATYQVLVPFYIAVQAVFFLVYCMYGDVSRRGGFITACCLVGAFLIGLAGYLTVSKILIYYKYDGSTGIFTNNYMGWGKNSLRGCLANIKGDVIRICGGLLPGLSRNYLPIMGLFLLLGVCFMIRMRRPAFLTLASMFILVTSPYYMTFLLGGVSDPSGAAGLSSGSGGSGCFCRGLGRGAMETEGGLPA